MPHDDHRKESINGSANEEGFTSKFEPMKLYCSICGRALTYKEEADEPVEIQLFTYQENGKRYSGVVCDECITSPKKRIIALHMVYVAGAVTMDVPQLKNKK
jgi:hypothetical protein